jgi:hypothetical protein
MGKFEKVFVITLLGLMAVLLIRKMYVESRIDREGVYVIGKVMESSLGGDAGWSHRILFQSGGVVYRFSFTGSSNSNADSLVFLRMLKESPTYVILVDDVKVPTCFNYNAHKGIQWSKVPQCK